MGDDGDGSEVETHQNFGDSDVFTRDKRVSVGIETIRVFFTGRLPSESFMQSHGPAESFTLDTYVGRQIATKKEQG